MWACNAAWTFRAFRIGFTIIGRNYSDDLQNVTSHEYISAAAEILSGVSMMLSSCRYSRHLICILFLRFLRDCLRITWWDCVKEDVKSLGLLQEDAQSGNKWKRKMKGQLINPS